MRNTSEAPVTDPDTAPGESDGGRQRVSVVIPCYNAEKWVGRAIQSVLDQPGVEAEVIVIDDGSTDGSLEVIRGFDGRTRWETGPNRGACAARNRGLELATAGYVMFLDADDYLEVPLLSGLIEQIQRHSADMAIGPLAEASEVSPPGFRNLPDTTDKNKFISDWITGQWVNPCAILWRREFVLDVGGWRTDLYKHQETELAIRCALRGAKITRSYAGCGVHWNNAGTTRISNEISERTWGSTIHIFTLIASEVDLAASENASLRRALSRATHALERSASYHALPGVLGEVAAFRRELGFPRVDGSIAHVLGARLLGLPRKERLSRWLGAQRRRLRASRS